jgi:hypothetical protein
MPKEKSKPQRATPPLEVDPNQYYSIAETSAILRQCRAQTYKDFHADRLVGFKKGRRTYVLGKEIIRASAAHASNVLTLGESAVA